ncbi:hypothetical protein ABBQ38_006847 [Trebouxia sp. C0009 RCD-2024]
MDPFDELARLSAPGASSRQTSQQGHSEPRQLPSASEPASQLAPNMSALPAAVRGNPFLDTPPKGITAPARARAVPNGAFQDLLPTDFSGVSRSNVSPMRSAAATLQTASAPAAPVSSDYSPLSQGLQGWDAFGEAAFQAPLDTSTPVVVDGLERQQVDLLFQQADQDRDGRQALCPASGISTVKAFGSQSLQHFCNFLCTAVICILQ